MGRAPCCEKMGLKKGPWTPEEDHILVSYIQKNGHGNWRALPKQAGLLRCGKSCRLRWTNYLRPDIKRGNFSKEEEDTIIQLHEMLGNRWSAIAARLPGRTDNEIKNVWHTHLKKKLKNYQATQDTKRQSNTVTKLDAKITMAAAGDEGVTNANFIAKQDANSPVSPQHSSSDLSSLTADSMAMATVENDHVAIKNEEMDSSEYLPPIDESFWSEEILSEDSGNIQSAGEIHGIGSGEIQFQFPFSPMAACEEDVNAYTLRVDDEMDFWYNLFIRAGDLPELPDF